MFSTSTVAHFPITGLPWDLGLRSRRKNAEYLFEELALRSMFRRKHYVLTRKVYLFVLRERCISSSTC